MIHSASNAAFLIEKAAIPLLSNLHLQTLYNPIFQATMANKAVIFPTPLEPDMI
jgi:hypothetical protein